MKNIFKKNQIIITALAIMIAVAGYLNFTGDDIKNDVAKKNTNKSQETVNTKGDDTNEVTDISDADMNLEVSDNGELLDVNTNVLPEDESEETSSNTAKDDDVGDATLVNKDMGSGIYSAAKIAREQTRAQNKETLMSIVDNTKLTENEKKEAINNIIKITDISEKENATETLLSAKGFKNCVVSIVDNSVDVVVSKEKLSQKEIAQIEDVVKRKTGFTANNIVITPTKSSN